LIIFLAMFAIGGTGLTFVAVHHCNQEDGYLEPTFMAPDDPHRLDERRRKGGGPRAGQR